MVARIDRWVWIRTLNDRLTAVLGPWRERHQDNPVLELMHGGRWLGHPLHPALSDLPIGLWAGALILDVTDRDPAPGRGLDPAGLFSAVGIAAAVATAATGMVDWTVSDDEDRRLGLFHGVLNTAALGLQGMSLAARLAGYRHTARGLGVASLAVTGGAAYLGGHLVFAKAVMVSRVAGADGPRRWVRAIEEAEMPDDVPTGVQVMAFVIVANLDDLESGETLFVEGLREPICLVRLDDDDVRAVHNTCTHQQQPLHEGTVQDDDTLVCASHNSRFDLTTGESVGIPVVPPLPVYACKVEGDAILVDIDQQLNDAPIPHRPYH